MFTPELTGICPGCDMRVAVYATEHTDGGGVITVTRTTHHECEALAAARLRGDDAPMRTLLLGAQ